MKLLTGKKFKINNKNTSNIVRINYCRGCRWLHRAAWMAQELLITFSEELNGASIITGDKGEFSIFLNQDLIFSRKEKGRFPELKEIKNLIRDILIPEKELGHSELDHLETKD